MLKNVGISNKIQKPFVCTICYAHVYFEHVVNNSMHITCQDLLFLLKFTLIIS